MGSILKVSGTSPALRRIAMDASLPFIAGTISTIIFAISTLPMLVKAHRTKDLGSYSIGNIVLANGGNAVHSLYVFSLPMGPIWLLHSFYLVTTGMMLFWYVRYEGWPRRPDRAAGSTSGESSLAMDAAGTSLT
jgi:uncharacterized protein with PQ loop repeat